MRALTAVTFTLTLLLILVQVAFAVRGIVDPAAGAMGFGYPTDSATASFYHAVYRDRNLVICVIGLALLFLRMRAMRARSVVGRLMPDASKTRATSSGSSGWLCLYSMVVAEVGIAFVLSVVLSSCHSSCRSTC